MKKSQIALAVGAVVLAGIHVAPAQASHDADLLAPYVVKDANRTTVISVIMTDVENTPPDPSYMHVQYWTKSTTDANTAACQPSSVSIPYTENDIVTFDTAGILGYPLFGDTTNPAPLGISISYAAPRHGYLVAGFSDLGGDISGYWLELDLANGGAHGDILIESDNNGDGDFSSVSGKHALLETAVSGSISQDPERPVVFWPSSVVTTAFTVTPLGSAMETRENNTVTVQVFNSNGVQGAYDRNENGVDGTVPITVRCVGRVTPAQLMPGVVANAAWAKQGGWGHLVNLGDGNATSDETSDLDAMVYQIDSSTVNGKFMSNATRIVSENY